MIIATSRSVRSPARFAVWLPYHDDIAHVLGFHEADRIGDRRLGRRE
jgi:hypothetical protein